MTEIHPHSPGSRRCACAAIHTVLEVRSRPDPMSRLAVLRRPLIPDPHAEPDLDTARSPTLDTPAVRAGGPKLEGQSQDPVRDAGSNAQDDIGPGKRLRGGNPGRRPTRPGTAVLVPPVPNEPRVRAMRANGRSPGVGSPGSANDWNAAATARRKPRSTQRCRRTRDATGRAGPGRGRSRRLAGRGLARAFAEEFSPPAATGRGRAAARPERHHGRSRHSMPSGPPTVALKAETRPANRMPRIVIERVPRRPQNNQSRARRWNRGEYRR